MKAFHAISCQNRAAPLPVGTWPYEHLHAMYGESPRLCSKEVQRLCQHYITAALGWNAAASTPQCLSFHKTPEFDSGGFGWWRFNRLSRIFLCRAKLIIIHWMECKHLIFHHTFFLLQILTKPQNMDTSFTENSSQTITILIMKTACLGSRGNRWITGIFF